jgi:hypothetical protein
VIVTWLRWIAVAPAGVAGWYIAFLVGLGILDGATRLCPAESMVSGACVAPWFPFISKVIFCVSTALAAILVVLLPALVAPGHRFAVACVAFGVGVLFASYFVLYTDAVAEFVSAVAAGLLTVLGVLRVGRVVTTAKPNPGVVIPSPGQRR